MHLILVSVSAWGKFKLRHCFVTQVFNIWYHVTLLVSGYLKFNCGSLCAHFVSVYLKNSLGALQEGIISL